MKKENIKAALFDLDGVVFDTEPQYTLFWGGIMHRYFPGQSELAVKIKCSTLTQIYDRYFGDRPYEQENITKELDAFEHDMHFDYIPGFEDFIKSLKANGVKTAVVTSSNVPKMENVYRKHPEFKSYFDEILTSEDFKESKPSPDCYLTAACRFNIEQKDCVVFEDSFNGLKSGKAAEMYVVGLATTNSPEDIKPFCDEVIKDYK